MVIVLNVDEQSFEVNATTKATSEYQWRALSGDLCAPKTRINSLIQN